MAVDSCVTARGLLTHSAVPSATCAILSSLGASAAAVCVPGLDGDAASRVSPLLLTIETHPRLQRTRLPWTSSAVSTVPTGSDPTFAESSCTPTFTRAFFTTTKPANGGGGDMATAGAVIAAAGVGVGDGARSGDSSAGIATAGAGAGAATGRLPPATV
jgi:hypothetical protein